MVTGFQEMGLLVFLVFDFRRERKGRLWLSLSKTQRMERKQWDRRLTYKAGGGEVGGWVSNDETTLVCLLKHQEILWLNHHRNNRSSG